MRALRITPAYWQGYPKRMQAKIIRLYHEGQLRICGLFSSSANSAIKAAACSVILEYERRIEVSRERIGNA